MFKTDRIKKIVEIKNLVHKFVDKDEEGKIISEKYAVDNVSLDIDRGDFITILGHNGSGKSTLAKHINAILMPDSGTLYVNGRDTAKEENLWDVRQSAGMVFQNPDNQIIATVVEEDVGFGPENLGVPTEDIWKRVEYALKAVGMTEYRHHSPARLSGGQKQRVAIAGVLAMKPDCIVLDEPTAMLDPGGRKEVIKTLHELNRRENVTIILITHHMEEVIESDKVFVMDMGKIALQGTPEEIFSQYEKMKEAGLDVPVVSEITHLLKTRGIFLPAGIISRETFAAAVRKYADGRVRDSGECEISGKLPVSSADAGDREVIFSLRDVSYIYSPDSVYRKQALRDVSLDIYKGEFLGIIGHTGSGKSTLVQHLNGLNRASSGEILFENQDIYGENYKLSSLRKKVGIVFQYPEHQLFETTVLQDVCFGPKNLGYRKEEAEHLAKEALHLTGIGEEYYEMSPFELSGGQKRRAAIAGVLAMKPEVLILDEPAAALDPRGRDEIFSILRNLHKSSNITIVLVSHSMEDIAEYAERIIVMDKGEKVMDDIPVNIFRRHQELEKMGLAAPEVTYIMEDLRKSGLKVDTDIISIEKAANEIYKVLNGAETC